VVCRAKYGVVAMLLLSIMMRGIWPDLAWSAQGKDKRREPGARPAETAAGAQDGLTVNAKGAVLMEGTSGRILYEVNKDQKIPPASFVKLMTLYIVFDSIRNDKLKFTDEVYISKKAWETGGSKMYVELGAKVPVEELIKGVAVVSGNDACVALAEHLAGSTETFVKQMNDLAKKLGMHNSVFENVHGLASDQQVATAYDMAILAKSYINAFPEALRFHSMQEYSYAGIQQYNRNRLLRKDSSVDGLKTGYISEESGYHLVATAKREERRLIAVVMGAKTRASREDEAMKLLTHGYRNFTFVSVLAKDKVLYELPAWKGKSGTLPVVAREAVVIVVPANQKDKIEHDKTLPEFVVAPIHKDQEVGTYVVKIGAEVIRTVPLLAGEELKRAAFPKVLWHSVLLLGKGKTVLFILLLVVVLGLGFALFNFAFSGRRRKIGLRL
jgi:serine-type D-Ala-D-Ala carboxypeptidase (penicillin-binding protein 5/6)